MPVRPRFRTTLAVAGLVLVLLPAAGPRSGSRAADEPMTEEDVVLLHVSGVPTDEIIEQVRAARVEFDLSDEMQDELRRAGLPSRLIQAMIDRRSELAGPEESEATPVPAESSLATLRIRLNADGESRDDAPRPVMRVLDDIDPPTRELLRLRTERPRFTDAAIFLACLTQDHVPDQWRSQTPLGRDYVSAPRHKLLAFLPGAVWKEMGKVRQFAAKMAVVPGERDAVAESGILELEVPAEIVVELEPGVIHDLVLGVALRTEERYYVIRSEVWEGLVLEARAYTVGATVKTGKPLSPEQIQIRFDRKELPKAADEPAPDA